MSGAADFSGYDRIAIAQSRRVMLRRLYGYLSRNRADYMLGLGATMVYAGFFVAFPILLGWCVQGIADAAPAEELTRRCAILFAVGVIRAGLRFFSRLQVFNGAREIEFQLRNDLFAHLQRLPQSFFFRWRTGDLMSRCVNDLTSVRLMLGPGLLQLAQTPVLMGVTIATMLVLNVKLAALVLLPIPFFLLIARAFGKAMFSTNLAVQVGIADMSNHLQETVSGVAVVKAYAMEPIQERRFHDLAQDLFEKQVHVAKVQGGMPAVTQLLPMAGMCLIFLVGGQMVIGGELSVGEFFTFATLNFELTLPLFFMGWMFSLVQRGTAAMQRIDEVLATEPSIADRADQEPVESLRGRIEFRDLEFGYPGPEDRAPALRGVSLEIPAGSVVGIVGPVGAGKTTLASLIPRLFEVEDGMVFIDGVDVNRIPLATLRKGIAMVPQDGFLFSMSLADNVAYGLDETDMERVRLAGERAQLNRDLSELPYGYGTVVGERGVMLSGGQRQRTALARALALDPAILILDDTLSAVDAETEAAIQRALREVFAGRTVVVVASRVSTVADADQIVVLDDGRVVEAGRHEELLLRGGLYARLARDQEAEARRLADLDAVEAIA